MATLQVIVATNEGVVVSDKTIDYTHPSEIPKTYNQLMTIDNPTGSYIVFGEIPEDYDSPAVNIYAKGLRAPDSWVVTLVGEIVGRLDVEALHGTVALFDKAQQRVSFRVTAKDFLHLSGYAPYQQKPEITITDPTGHCMIGIQYNQKLYVPQPDDVIYDITPPDAPQGESYHISFIAGEVNIKPIGFGDIFIFSITDEDCDLEQYLKDHSDYDAPIMDVDGKLACLSTRAYPTSVAGRVFPLNTAEAAEVLTLINTDDKYIGLRNKFLNPFDYGTVEANRTFTGSVNIVVDADVTEALADNTKSFLVGSLVDKKRVDDCLAAITDDYAVVGGRSKYEGQNLNDPQLSSSNLNRATLQTMVADAIVYKSWYLFPADIKLKGDSGRLLHNPGQWSLPAPGTQYPSLSTLSLTVDVRYDTTIAEPRNLAMRMWPVDENEFVAVRNAMNSQGTDTGAWVNPFTTDGLTKSTTGVRTEYEWAVPPVFNGSEWLGAGIAINRTVANKILNGNYNDSFVIGTYQSSTGGVAGTFTFQSFKDLIFNAITIGDEYFLGTKNTLTISCYNAKENNQDMKGLKINMGDTTGTRYVENHMEFSLSFTDTAPPQS